jgi:putative membrane protein
MVHAHQIGLQAYGILLVLIVTASMYVRGWLRVRRLNLQKIEGWRAGSFLLGLFLIWVAVASPLAQLDQELLTAHMVQHLLLMTFAAPLIWFGEPVMPLLHGPPANFVKAVILPLLRRPVVGKFGRALAQPAVCWLAAGGALVGWHIPAVFMVGMHSGNWHSIQHASFLVAGLLFWWPVIQPWPAASRQSEWPILLYLFLATLPCDILSGFLVFCDRLVYPIYLSSTPNFRMSALEDQQCAGALMWTCVTVVFLVVGSIFTARLLSPESSRREHWIPQTNSQASAVLQEFPQTTEVL